MAHFILQTGAMSLDLEEILLEKELKRSRLVHSYEKTKFDDLISGTDYPVGDIKFVEKYLGIKENPIELPKYLRTDEFLKRDYRIVDYTQVPWSGQFFLKDVSSLKEFGQVINATYMDMNDLFNHVKTGEFDSTLVLDKTHLFQVSSIFNYKAEYRVYIIGGVVENICLYNGSPLYQPDINLIQKVVNLVTLHEKWLISYTIDVMVGKEGTAIVEIHNFASVGLYSTQWGSELPYAYIDGINYLRNDNKLLEV